MEPQQHPFKNSKSVRLRSRFSASLCRFLLIEGANEEGTNKSKSVPLQALKAYGRLDLESCTYNFTSRPIYPQQNFRLNRKLSWHQNRPGRLSERKNNFFIAVNRTTVPRSSTPSTVFASRTWMKTLHLKD